MSQPLKRVRICAVVVGMVVAILFMLIIAVLRILPAPTEFLQTMLVIIVSGVCGYLSVNFREELKCSNDGGALKPTAIIWTAGVGGLLMGLVDMLLKGQYRGNILSSLLYYFVSGFEVAFFVMVLISIFSIPLYLILYIFKIKTSNLWNMNEFFEQIIYTFLSVFCVLLVWVLLVTGKDLSDLFPKLNIPNSCPSY